MAVAEALLGERWSVVQVWRGLDEVDCCVAVSRGRDVECREES